MTVMRNLKEFFGFEEMPEVKPLLEEADIAQPQEKSFKGAIINNQKNRTFSLGEIKVVEPRIYEDSLNIAQNLRENTPVIIKLKYLDAKSGKRLIDFICGTAYAINGHMMKIAENIFLFTPSNVLIVENEEQTTFEQGLAQEEKEVFFQKAV